MKDNNKRNILYFESNSMKDLHDNMNEWQIENEKRFLSMSINKDEGQYCCIALTNPTEVVIVDPDDGFKASVSAQGFLNVEDINNM